jgi:hypothetical protein
MTFQPLPAKGLAAALPMPEEQPVMRTVFFKLYHASIFLLPFYKMPYLFETRQIPSKQS